MNDNETEYWFNLKTGEVEVGKQSIALFRVGPFKTREEAENALETIAERAADWALDENDDDWPSR